MAEALAGIAGAEPPYMFVRAGFEWSRQPGRCEFLPARLGGYDGHATRSAQIAASAVSHRVALLAQADGLLLIPAEMERTARGHLLGLRPFMDGARRYAGRAAGAGGEDGGETGLFWQAGRRTDRQGADAEKRR